MFKELNNKILTLAKRVDYVVKDIAPSTIADVLAQKQLVIWSGESDNTVWNDPAVNHAFRALHDALHIETGLGFTVPEEIELGRIQASLFEGVLADLVYLEVAGQALEYQRTGNFVSDQRRFTIEALSRMGYKVA